MTCKDDLEAHFTEKVIGNMAVDVLDIGTVHFPTGQIFACDPLVELEDTLPFLQTIPAGTYPVKICVVPSEQYGDRYACVKVEVSREKPVRHELGMVGNEDLDAALGDDDYFGFGVDAGMGCIADIQTQAAFKTYWANLQGLHGIELKDFDLTGLAAVHPHLKELRLWGAPGNLGNFSAVRGFREMTNLSTFDLFGFGADDIPTPEQMPELRWFWMTSLPETAAKAAKQFWKSKPGMDLRITKPRKPEWLAQNLDNPFRGWDGAEHIPAAAAKKAANQYRKTRSQLMKLAAEPGEDAQAQALDAVTAYTQTFNKMGFIETEDHLPTFMKTAKNRERIVKLLRQMQEK